MSKPWDEIRVESTPRKKPIGVGRWRANSPGEVDAFVRVNMHPSLPGHVVLGMGGEAGGVQPFTSTGLRQLAEFCTELADQLEGR